MSALYAVLNVSSFVLATFLRLLTVSFCSRYLPMPSAPYWSSRAWMLARFRFMLELRSPPNPTLVGSLPFSRKYA